MNQFGVYSEVGKLCKVLVHRPELSLQRLTPANHDDLLFDDVLWVEHAQKEHDEFVARMRERGVTVYYLRDLMAETLAASAQGKKAIVYRVVSEMTVGVALVDELRAYLMAMEPDTLAQHLIGGLTKGEAKELFATGPLGHVSLIAATESENDFILPPGASTTWGRG